MNRSVEQQIQRELVPGERLLWCGRPRGGLQFSSGLDWIVYMLGLLFVLICTRLLIDAARIEFRIAEGELVPDVALPVLMALGTFSTAIYMVVVPLRSWRRTVYGLTDLRAIIVGGVFRREVESLPLHSMTTTNVVLLDHDPNPLEEFLLPAMTTTNIVLRQRGDQYGTIMFLDMWWRGDRERTLAFSRIEAARHVHSLIQDAIASRRRRRSPWRQPWRRVSADPRRHSQSTAPWP